MLMISEERLRKIVREEIAEWYKTEVIEPQMEFINAIYQAEKDMRDIQENG